MVNKGCPRYDVNPLCLDPREPLGGSLFVSVYEASFLETTMTVNPELLNLMKCK